MKRQEDFSMNTIYEQQGSTYQKQGNYFIPCVAVREQKVASWCVGEPASVAFSATPTGEIL